MKQDKNELIELVTLNPNINLDIRYATTNNFTKKIVYPHARCYLRKEAAHALMSVIKELEPLELSVKIFDGYRPIEAQKIFWNFAGAQFPDETERALYTEWWHFDYCGWKQQSVLDVSFDELAA